MFYFEEQDTMRSGRSAENGRKCEQADPRGSQASHAKKPEDLPLSPNANEAIGTLAGMIREQARAQAEQARAYEAHLKCLEELHARAQQGPVERERERKKLSRHL